MRDDEKLKSAKRVYIQDQDFNAYQKVLRSISHRYIDVLFLVEKSLARINCLLACLLVCPHLTDWSKNYVKI